MRTENNPSEEQPRPPGLLFRRPNLDNLPAINLPAGYEIRPFQPGDEKSAAETLSRSFEDEWTVERVKRDLSENDFVKTMFVAVHDGKVVATASAASGGDWDGIGYVHFVGTHPDHTGKALGYWVTAACLHEFRRLGYPSAALHTDDHRIPAIKTYLKLGFALDVDAHPSYRPRWDKILAAHPELTKR